MIPDVGFYLFVYNVNNYGVEIYGPYPSESDTTFNQLLNTPYIIPYLLFRVGIFGL